MEEFLYKSFYLYVTCQKILSFGIYYFTKVLIQMKKLFLLMVVLFYSISVSAQQEPMYTQFMFNKMAINPAYCGHEKVWSLTALYRNQWIGFEGAPDAQTISLNSPVFFNKIGLGLNLKRQAIGVTKLLTIEGLYSYKLRVGESVLSLGLQFSARNYSVNFRDERLLSIHDISIDSSIPQEQLSKIYLNTGFGVYYNFKSFYIGASLPRLIRSDLTFNRIGSKELFSEEKRHMLFMTGLEVFLGESSSITPQLLVKIAENSPFDFDFDLNYNYKQKYTLGLNYRYGGANRDFGESIDFILGMQMNEKIFAALAYDVGLSKLRAYHNGSIELMIHYKFKKVDHTIEHINPRFY